MRRNKVSEISFINVGNGDAILLEIPDENYREDKFVMVIDGGSGETAEYENSYTGRIRAVDYMNKKEIHHVDVMVCTHIHEDHTCGLLAIAEKWMPNILIQPFDCDWYQHMTQIACTEGTESVLKFVAALNAYRKLCNCVKESGGKIIQLILEEALPEIIFVPRGVEMEVYGPDKRYVKQAEQWMEQFYVEKDHNILPCMDSHMNQTSIMFKIKVNGKSFLFTGDTQEEGYSLGKDGMQEELKVDVWKVGHHGQANSMNENIVRHIAPEYAVICASSDRRYDSAAPEILKLLKEARCQTYFTDCQKISGDTKELEPHNAVCFTVSEAGCMDVEYIVLEKKI